MYFLQSGGFTLEKGIDLIYLIIKSEKNLLMCVLVKNKRFAKSDFVERQQLKHLWVVLSFSLLCLCCRQDLSFLHISSPFVQTTGKRYNFNKAHWVSKQGSIHYYIYLFCSRIIDFKIRLREILSKLCYRINVTCKNVNSVKQVKLCNGNRVMWSLQTLSCMCLSSLIMNTIYISAQRQWIGK